MCQIIKCICSNFKIYLSKLQNTFVQIAKCISEWKFWWLAKRVERKQTYDDSSAASNRLNVGDKQTIGWTNTTREFNSHPLNSATITIITIITIIITILIIITIIITISKQLAEQTQTRNSIHIPPIQECFSELIEMPFLSLKRN